MTSGMDIYEAVERYTEAVAPLLELAREMGLQGACWDIYVAEHALRHELGMQKPHESHHAFPWKHA